MSSVSSGTTFLTSWTTSLPTEWSLRVPRNAVSEPIEDVPGSRNATSDLWYDAVPQGNFVPRRGAGVPRPIDDVPDSMNDVPDVRN
jgi:hypothetical protein